jgi:hypothetical protein
MSSRHAEYFGYVMSRGRDTCPGQANDTYAELQQLRPSQPQPAPRSWVRCSRRGPTAACRASGTAAQSTKYGAGQPIAYGYHGRIHIGGYTRGLPEQAGHALQVVGRIRSTSAPAVPAMLRSCQSTGNRTRPRGTRGTSRRGAQRSRAAASTTSRLSHPVSSRLAAGPHRSPAVLHVLLQCRHVKVTTVPARKRPSPR